MKKMMDVKQFAKILHDTLVKEGFSESVPVADIKAVFRIGEGEQTDDQYALRVALEGVLKHVQS